MIRPAIVILLLLPTFALGQAKPDKDKEKENKVSNDDPSRPFQMPPATPEVKEAIDDFERFGRRGAWERALKALYSIPEAQTLRFIDGDDGFIIPVARKRHALLGAMPADGLAAYKTFHDDDARKLFEEADGPNQLKDLERVYSAYFTTSIGDNAADRLGDLYYELGRFDRAADCWLAILRERPDTDLSLALISTKAALALHRAGRKSEFAQLRAELKERHDDEQVTVGGITAKPSDHLARLIADESPSKESAAGWEAGPTGPGPNLEGPVGPAWQLRFAQSIEAGMTPLEMGQWEGNPLSMAVPAVTSLGSKLYVNYLGFIFALDAKSGKMLWRSGSFHHLDVLAMNNNARMLEPNRFAIIAEGDLLWTLGRDLKDPNGFGPYRLTCRRAAGGEVVWKSDDHMDYAQVDLVGAPMLVDGKIFIVGKGQPNAQPGMPPQQGMPQQIVLAIQARDGKLLWRTDVGTFRQGGNNMMFFYYMPTATVQPRLVLRAGALYVDTHSGVLARLDAESGMLDWGYGYRTGASQGMNRFRYYEPQSETTASSAPLWIADSLVIKGAGSDHLEAIDPDRMKSLWERPISGSSRLLGGDDRVVFFGGPEISALDLKTKELLWATRLPGGSLESRVLVRPDGIWQMTPRGIFEVDPKSGAVRRIFRGEDLGAVAGNLFLTDQWLLSVSNRSISAYPRQASRADRPAPGDPQATRMRASNE